MSFHDLHQVILRWPSTDANEVIVTGTFDQASLPILFSSLFLLCFSLMPGITTGFSLRLPSFISSSAPHLCIQWSSSLRLTRKPDGFEVPILIPWRDKIAYKFIVDGRWMTNDAEPTENDRGYVNNVYTAPPKPTHANAPPAYHTESEIEPERTEKVPVHADKPAANGSVVSGSHEAPEPTAESAPEQTTTVAEEAKAATPLAVEAAQAAVAQVAPGAQEVERAAHELVSEPQAPKEPVPSASEPVQTPISEPAPSVVGTLSKPTPSGTSSEGPTVAPAAPAAAEINPEPEPSTHVPLPSVAGSTAQTEEAALAPAPDTVPDAALEAHAAPAEGQTEVLDTKAATEPESGPASATTELVEPARVEEPPAASELGVAPAPEPEEIPAAVPERPTEPTPALAESTPVHAVEPTPAAASEPKPEVEAAQPSDPPSSSAPGINGHPKSASSASGSTPVPPLTATPTRKASHKFSFPGRDKSGNSSPTSSRFSSQQKREKRHSLLGKLKDIFSDRDKKERKEKKEKA